MKTTIKIEEISVLCTIGVNLEERAEKQTIIITVELTVDADKARTEDKLSETVDYSILYRKIVDLSESSNVKLLETLAVNILKLCLSFPKVLSSKVSVTKPNRLPKAKGVTVTIEESRVKRG